MVIITEANLMAHSQDWAWVNEYAEKMGDRALVEYSHRLYTFLNDLPDGSVVEVERVVKAGNADLFAKCVSRFIYEGVLDLQFSADYRRIRKWDKK